MSQLFVDDVVSKEGTNDSKGGSGSPGLVIISYPN